MPAVQSWGSFLCLSTPYTFIRQHSLFFPAQFCIFSAFLAFFLQYSCKSPIKLPGGGGGGGVRNQIIRWRESLVLYKPITTLFFGLTSACSQIHTILHKYRNSQISMDKKDDEIIFCVLFITKSYDLKQMEHAHLEHPGAAGRHLPPWGGHLDLPEQDFYQRPSQVLTPYVYSMLLRVHLSTSIFLQK